MVKYDLLIFFVFLTFSIVKFEPAPFDILIIIAIFLGIVLHRLNLKLWFSFSFINLLIALFIIGNLISLFFVTNLGRATFYISATIYLILFFYFVASYIISWRQLSIIWIGYLGAGIAAVILGWLAYFNLVPFSNFMMYDLRLMVLFKDPNVFGPFFVPLITGILAAIFYPDIWKIKKKFKILLLLIFMLSVIFSGSRGAWLNLVVAILTFLSLYFTHLQVALKKKIGIIFFIFLISFICIGFSIFFGNEYLERRAGLQTYDEMRFKKQLEALDVSLKSIWGIGPGHSEIILGFATHNTYLRVLLENGWFSFLVFISLIIFLLWKCFEYSLIFSSQKAIIFMVLFASLSGILVNGLFIDTLHWRHFWVLLGMIVGLIYFSKNHEKSSLFFQY